MPNVLLVDDEASIRLTMGEFLKRAGYSVLLEPDYDRAVRHLAENLDVAVIDINLAGKSGIQLLHKLSNSDVYVPVIMITGEPNWSVLPEIVRAGVLSVHKGQMEAGSSLGLSRGSTLRLIVVPQAMRVILPPLTNQYLNLTKNSSLAVAIGYPDLFSVFAGTTLSQTGQAIEIISITMGVYLLISLITSGIMSFYGWRLDRSMNR